MKKIVLVAVLVLFSGCSFNNAEVESENNEDKINELESENIEIDNFDVFSELEELLKTENIVEIDENPGFILPDNIHEKQLRRFLRIGDIYFATVVQDISLSPSGAPRDFPRPLFSGILWSKQGGMQWHIFLQEKGANLPLYLGNQEGSLFLSIVDGNGGGTGEGILKLLFSDDFGKNWELERCIYQAWAHPNYLVYTGIENENDMGIEIMEEFSKNPQTNKFEGNWGGKKIVEENCHNFEIEVNSHEK